MFRPSIDYFFNTQPPPFSLLGNVFLGTSILAIICGAALAMCNTKIPIFYRKMARKAKRALMWYGGISLLIYFLRFQQIPYLSMRLWLWVWFFGFFLLLVLTLYREYRKIPGRKQKLEDEIKLKRYAG